jgi:hypothetical protein
MKCQADKDGRAAPVGARRGRPGREARQGGWGWHGGRITNARSSEFVQLWCSAPPSPAPRSGAGAGAAWYIEVMYDDGNPSCRETFATFRVAHESLAPESITRDLGLEPSAAHRKGDLMYPKNPASDHRHRSGQWSLSTNGRVESRDLRRHVVWLLDRLEPKRAALVRLQCDGFRIDIFCFWCSAAGQGGPMLDPNQMGRLASLALPIVFDVYIESETGPPRREG